MSALVAMAAAPIAVVWLLPFAADLLALLRRRRPVAAPGAAARARILVLVPAHNEELLIASCVRSLLAARQERTEAQIVVIADNSTDGTARLAREAGAAVLERHDTTLRGKPWAIEWAMKRLETPTFDAVLIVDADTEVDPGFLDAFAAHAPLRDKAVQGYFGLSNEEASWLSRLAGLLARVRYEGQYLLKERAGLNCPLTGNGMCLGTALLARAGWAPDALTENWELYARYTARNETITFAPLARLYAQEATSMRQSGVQRKRWQAGRWMALRRHGASLVRQPGIPLAQRVDALAELTAPGPILHATVAIAAGTALTFLPSASARVVGGAFLVSTVPSAVWTLRAWLRGPHRLALALALLRLPAYAIWRAVVALLAISTGRKGEWQRSPRQHSGAA